ncbi:MAG: TolC family outer membrane protein [Spiribacter sp.]|jgi:outer membrane protein|nr:TolC family outer membrane protein [Spiribacter sp.]MDR9489986.1 TolC family outer membrane protein [Spiribacter sp.]
MRRSPQPFAGFITIATLAGLLLPVASVWAADDLLSIYERARTSDPEFQQALADRQAREEALPQARAGLRPQVSLESAYQTIDTDSDIGTQQDVRYEQLNYGVSLSQPLYRYSQARRVDQTSAQVEQARAEFTFAEQALILRAAERYFAVLDAREAVDAAEASLQAIERQLEQAEQRFEVGVIARTDVEEAKAQSDLARASLLQSRDDLESQREALRELTNQAPALLASVREGASLNSPEPADPSQWRDRAQEDNRELLAAQFAAQAAMEGIDVERGARFPQLDIVANYSGVDQYEREDSDPSSDQWSAGIELSMPLYQGGGIRSSVREAQFRYTEAREVLEQTRRSVSRDAANAYRGALTALERVRALDQARVSTQAALDATEAGFEVGTRTIVDVLNAQRERFNAERDYEQARHAYLVNTLRLKQAAGTLSVADLRRVNALLSD